MKKNAGSEVSGPGFATHYFYVMSQNMAQGTVAEWRRWGMEEGPQGQPLPMGEANSHKKGQKSRASGRSASRGCGHKGPERALRFPHRWAKFGWWETSSPNFQPMGKGQDPMHGIEPKDRAVQPEMGKSRFWCPGGTKILVIGPRWKLRHWNWPYFQEEAQATCPCRPDCQCEWPAC